MHTKKEWGWRLIQPTTPTTERMTERERGGRGGGRNRGERQTETERGRRKRDRQSSAWSLTSGQVHSVARERTEVNFIFTDSETSLPHADRIIDI